MVVLGCGGGVCAHREEAKVVQIVWSSRKGSRQIEHLGSAHDEGQLKALKAVAAQRLTVGQQSLDLVLDQPGSADAALALTPRFPSARCRRPSSPSSASH